MGGTSLSYQHADEGKKGGGHSLPLALHLGNKWIDVKKSIDGQKKKRMSVSFSKMNTVNKWQR